VVRRYIRDGNTGERTPEAEHVGVITEAEPHADGWFLWLDSYEHRIFTGYQFLGAGKDGHSPASLVTEVIPVQSARPFRVQLTPDLALVVDSSQCIVLVVTDGAAGNVLRRITVTDVGEFKDTLDAARAAQHEELAEASLRSLAGITEKRRAEGKLGRSGAVEWLIDKGQSRGAAVSIVERLCRGGKPVLGMKYEGGYWTVPVTSEQTAR
jgi:hypothetical protein